MTNPSSFDLQAGSDSFNVSHRRMLWKVLEEQRPLMVALEPVCRVFSQMMKLAWRKKSPRERSELSQRGHQMLDLSMVIALYQHRHGRRFFLEHPWGPPPGASRW